MKYPRPTTGTANAEILKLNPKIETIQAVIVVPILAPKITPADWAKEMSPAFTNVTTITVVAPEDWIIIVMSIPVKIATTLLLVTTLKVRCNFSPALFWTPSDMSFIP